MPSPLHIPVASISQITPHPNAERLEIAQLLGWQVVVGRGQFKEGDAVVLFPPDTVLTQPFSDHLGVTQYLDKGRVKATRLRGEPSFGLVIKATDDMQVGEDVAERYPWISKWEPPTREEKQRRQGQPGQPRPLYPNELPKHTLFPEFTHIDNLRHFPDLFDHDEIVIVTEKLHGTNSRIGIIDGEWMAGSHKVRRGEGDALYWEPRSQAGVTTLLTELAKHHKQVILYGEILGAGVQSLSYGYEGHEGYAAFDLMVDGRYLEYDAFSGTCSKYGVSMVPLLHQGYYHFDRVRKLAEGPTILNDWATHLREGVVVRPLIERSDAKVGRVVAKYVSDDYLCMPKKSDYAEV